MPLHRRDCLIWGASLATLSMLGACTSMGRSSAKSGLGYGQYTLGDARITAINDGVGRRTLQEGFVRNQPLDKVQATLDKAGLPITHLDIPYTCYVVELGGKRYLLDTGFADNGAAGTGHLHQHMRAAGITPESIDVVILSHLHGDHIQGLRRKDGTLVYPHAMVYVPRPEMDFWLDDALMQATPEAARSNFHVVRRVFKHYPQAQLQLYTPGDAIAPGILSMPAFGHTPGHTAIHVQSNGPAFTYIGDAAHLPVLFVRHPDWHVQFDMDPEQATATRRALLSLLTQDNSWVGGYHFPLPGMGRISPQADGFHWSIGK